MANSTAVYSAAILEYLTADMVSKSGDGNFEIEEEVGKRFYPMVPVPVSLLIL
jgi:hypothetical protein